MEKNYNPLDMTDFLVKAKKEGMFMRQLGEMGKAVIKNTGKPRY